MDHYQLLGIKRSANKDEIKKAYHKLALKYHPDKNSDSTAEDKFRAVNEAYEVLKDDQKRETYDRFDLIQTQGAGPNTSSTQHNRHQFKDDHFFKGSSDRLSKEQKLQDELERIRRINSELLDAANARLKKSCDRSSGTNKFRPSDRKFFMGEILANEEDESYETIVLDRLRACESNR